MSFRLIVTRPDGSVFQTSTTPVERGQAMGLEASYVLGGECSHISIASGKALGRAVREADVGQNITHEPSGYHFRIEEF